MALKPFDIVRDVCDKCERTGNSSEAFHVTCPLEAAEHIHYTCRMCGYEWASAPGDAPL